MGGKDKNINELIEMIDAGCFEQYKAIREGITMEAIENFLGKKFQYIRRLLSGKPVNYFELPLVHQAQPLQCFIDETGTLILLRLEDALMKTSLEVFVGLFGEPELKRNLVYPEKYAPSTQWIYASKGITLYVLNKKVSDQQLTCIALYEMTTPSDYLERLGGTETVTYFSN